MFKFHPNPSAQRPDLLKQGVVIWLATGMGFGLSPFAPGTVGALWGLPLAWAVASIPAVWAQLAVILLVSAAGVPLCTAAGRKLGGSKDPGCIVFDEIASMPITFFLVPMSGLAAWPIVLTGFVLNRIADIVKPPPARRCEHLPEGLGIMADDWIAGIYSNLALHLLIWLGVFRGVGG
jgi:phosphatidylglycerophosphatase A